VGARFGTDGIRGLANTELTVEVALAVGRAAARVLPAEAFAIGRDTRLSGPMLQAAVAAGIAAEGADVVDLGILPTAGVAWFATDRSLPGVVVSASHNPFEDNGIKLFAPGGTKLPLDVEEALEEELEGLLTHSAPARRPPGGRGVGTLSVGAQVSERYVSRLLEALEGRDLAGTKVVIDCANGAAYEVAPEVLRRAGAQVTAVFCEPDGTNINAGCGSTCPDALVEAVVASGADLGLALDGDADRLVAVDHTGRVLTGDELIAMFALDMSKRGKLAGNTVVVTVMSNLGLHMAMADNGISVRCTDVGDRFVNEAMLADGLVLGGEQSGHIVFREWATTGDGILTGLLLVDLVVRSGGSLSELAASSMRRLPQVLLNVPVDDPSVASHEQVVAEARSVGEELGESGRVLVRASGTEAVVRVMVEAPDEEAAQAAAKRISMVVASLAGGEMARLP
jgi:phosphoglucosamine mutase